jgi:hypothetical protein
MASFFFKSNFNFGTQLGPIRTIGEGIGPNGNGKLVWIANPDDSNPLDPGGEWVWVDDPPAGGGGGRGGYFGGGIGSGGQEGGGLGGGIGGGALEGGGGYSGGHTYFFNPTQNRWVRQYDDPPVKETCPHFIDERDPNGLYSVCTPDERGAIQKAFNYISHPYYSVPDVDELGNPIISNKGTEIFRILSSSFSDLFACLELKWCELKMSCGGPGTGFIKEGDDLYGLDGSLTSEVRVGFSRYALTMKVETLAHELLRTLILGCGGTLFDALFISSLDDYLWGYDPSDEKFMADFLKGTERKKFLKLNIIAGKYVWYDPEHGFAGSVDRKGNPIKPTFVMPNNLKLHWRGFLKKIAIRHDFYDAYS